MTDESPSKSNSMKKLWAWLMLPLLSAAVVALLAVWSYPSAGELVLPGKPVVVVPPLQAASSSQPMTSPVAPQRSELEASKSLDERIKDVESAQKALYMNWLDGQRKTIDWWLTYLGVTAALLALGGAFIPFLMGRKDKEYLDHLLREANDAVAQTKSHRDSAKGEIDAIKVLRQTQSGQDQTPATQKKLEIAAETVKNNPQANAVDKLRAMAVQASTARQAEQAFRLWAAVSAIEPNDHVAQFNAGYWAHDMLENAPGLTRGYWQAEVGQRYAKVLAIKPDKHEAANNWGAALDTEATAVAPTDLPAARALWKQAGEKYAQALTIKPDKHEAANNWGAALLGERAAVAGSSGKDANDLLQRATEMLQKRSEMAPVLVAYNLACCFALAGDTAGALKWLQVSRENGTLPAKAHILDDHDFDGIRGDDVFAEWFKSLPD